MLPPSHHVELALYEDEAIIIAESRKPTLLFRYLETYLDFSGGGVNGELPLMILSAS